MAFWEQEWKTHYDSDERTYNIPEEKIWELLEEVNDLNAEKKSFWEHQTKDEIIANLKEENEGLENHLVFWVKQGGIKKFEDLQKENKKLKEEITHKNNKFSEWIEENRQLKEENKCVLESIEGWKKAFADKDKQYQGFHTMSLELTKEVEKLKDDKWQEGYDKGVLENSVDKEFLEEKEQEIAKLQKLVDEYKKCSLREKEATPQEITDYMKELSTELEAVQKDYEELSMWEAEVYETIDHDVEVSRDDVIDFIKSYDFYDTELMHELSKEWANVWNCLHQEEENVYRQEGFDPEVEDHELEDGMTYTSMRRITYMIELPCWNGKYRERLGDHIILGDNGAEEGGD